LTCYQPLKGYRSKESGPDGKRKIVFNTQTGHIDLPVPIPCRQCIGCRLERSRQWAIRCKHESDLYTDNCYITLTYNPEHLPASGSVEIRHFQLFLKRLRKKFGSKIRFFACGEYGELNHRPHYHACIFNFRFDDLVFYKNLNDHPLYTSEKLSSLWGKGFCTVGDVTFQSAAYVARYIMKKITGPQANDHYEVTDPETGEITHSLNPEYVHMSRRPGIGKLWLNQFTSDVYPHDEVIINGKSIRPPNYYDEQYKLENPIEFEKIQKLRKIKIVKNKLDNTPDRLAIKEILQTSQASQLKRSLEKEI
jgi:hypothetical protein